MTEYEYNLLKMEIDQLIEENKILIHLIKKHLPQYEKWLKINFGNYDIIEN